MDSKIVESSAESVRSQFGYIISYQSNLQRLKMEFYNLQATKNCVQHYVNKAERDNEKIVDTVHYWLDKVNGVMAEAKKLINNVHAKEKYCMRCFPNLWFRHQQSKKYQKMTQVIYQVQTEANFQRISYPEGIGGLNSKPSRASTLEEIQQVLKDPNMYIIGLYGIDGVGKTTLMKELAEKAEKDGSFDVVVMVEVTDALINVRYQIANALDMKFDGGRIHVTEENLNQRIREVKNILIILDDISDKHHLVNLGIPFGEDHKGCKLLLTSNRRDVLKSQMGTQKDFKLDVLSDEDSWKLFEKIAGNDNQMNNIHVAQDVAKCCQGLPLFIVAVANALREKDASTWENALNQLKTFDKQGFSKDFVCPLELSYHYLKSDELKSFFLFIASVGLDCIHTRELFSCHRGLYGDLHTLTEAKEKYYELINDLKVSSLLLEGEIEYVRMHVVVRDTIKAIASRTHLTFEVQEFREMEQWDIDQLRKCHYINLPSYYVDKLPEKLDCPELKLMSLRRKSGYLTIPDNFFTGMRDVKVLNLHRMRFAPSPPPSLRLLKNLISLNLYGCVLEDIAIVAELKSLKILTLESSKIQQLPKEIGQLVDLQFLNLTNCDQLKIIPANLLSSLTRLEMLYMWSCNNIQWEVEGGKNHASVGELSHLNQLISLEVSIQDASLLPANMDVFPNPLRYVIHIGKMSKSSSLWSRNAHERILKLSDSRNTNIWLNRWVHALLTTVECLGLVELNFGKDEDDQSTPMPLFIQKVTFPNLETLVIECMDGLKSIWNNQQAPNSFCKLTKIQITECHALRNVFPFVILKEFRQLQVLEIMQSRNIENIVEENDRQDVEQVSANKNVDHILDQISFPQLKELKLEDLSSLTNFCKESYNFNFPSLRSVIVHGCPKMRTFVHGNLTTIVMHKWRSEKSQKDDDNLNNASVAFALFNEKVAMHNLEILELNDIGSHKIWDDKLPVHLFNPNLRILNVTRCDSLVPLFSPSAARALAKLQYLKISLCNGLVQIFSQQDVTFPNLETLIISDLFSLESIWNNQQAPNSFCKLRIMQIHNCKSLHHVLPIVVGKELPQHQELQISRCTTMENIVEKCHSRDTQDGVASTKLEELKFGSENKCHALGNVASMNLEELKYKADELDEIVFMKLEKLKLENLPSLTSFCSASYNFKSQKDDENLNNASVAFTLFNEKVAMPNLEILELNDIGSHKIWDDKLPAQFYSQNLRNLTVNECHGLVSLFSPSAARALVKLQYLEISHCKGLVEIFVQQEEVTFPNLETLIISDLFNLKSIWNNQQAPNSFCNLKIMQINNCDSLHHVLPIVVAKELPQLQELKISQCSNIENIVEKSHSHDAQDGVASTKLDALKFGSENKGDALGNVASMNLEELKYKADELDEIVFMKLEKLELKLLRRLTSFCKASYNFKFPELQTITMSYCPEMETFCNGNVITPRLSAVQYAKYLYEPRGYPLHGDLNTFLSM